MLDPVTSLPAQLPSVARTVGGRPSCAASVAELVLQRVFMGHLRHLVLVALAAGFLIGCATANREIPVLRLPPVPVDYEVIGDTTAEDVRTAIFLIDFEHLFSDIKTGSVSASASAAGNALEAFREFLGNLETSAKKAAVHKAVEKIPEADALLEPRYYVQSSGFWPFYVTVTAQVTAKAIKYTKSSPNTILRQ